jgi:hypothetical protein
LTVVFFTDEKEKEHPSPSERAGDCRTFSDNEGEGCSEMG